MLKEDLESLLIELKDLKENLTNLPLCSERQLLEIIYSLLSHILLEEKEFPSMKRYFN